MAIGTKITGVLGAIEIPTGAISMSDGTTPIAVAHIQRGTLVTSSDMTEILPAQDDAVVNTTSTTPGQWGAWVTTRATAARWRLTAEGVLDSANAFDVNVGFGTHGRAGTALAFLKPIDGSGRDYKGNLVIEELNVSYDRNGEARFTLAGRGDGALIHVAGS